MGIRIYGWRKKERERELYKSNIILGLTNARIMVHRREDLVTSSFDMIIRTYAAEHRRQSQLRPGIVTSIPKTEDVVIIFVHRKRITNYAKKIHFREYVKNNEKDIKINVTK